MESEDAYQQTPETKKGDGMTDRELAFTPAYELVKLVADKKVSPVALTRVFLERIERLNPELNAYLTVTADEAMESAKAAEQAVMDGQELGPLHGVPVSVKDLEATPGIRTTFGSLIFKDYVPDFTSGVAERVKTSGAVMLGKTNTPEFGQLGTTENRLGPACANPWDTTRTTGGSSGGAGAALAAGLCSLATGSDAGGSIRIPASFCGVYGIKPTLGRVPRFGGVGRPSPNPVSQPGPMSLTVRDSALFLNVLAGPDDRDVITLRDKPPDYLEGLDDGVSGLRMAWSLDMGFAAVDPEVAGTTSESAAVFEELGATVDEPGLELGGQRHELQAIMAANLYASYGHFLEERSDDLTDYVRERLDEGKAATGSDYARALRLLEQLDFDMDVLMERYDLLLTPTMAVPAFPIGEKPGTIGGRDVDPDWAFNPFNLVANVTRRPAASVPCGFSSDGLPIGLQIVGRRGQEAMVLRASAAFEKARPWADKHPPVS